MAPLLKFQFAAHLTRFDGHQRRNQTSATMLGSSKILHWHSWKSSSGNPGILEGQIARMIIQGIHLKARHVSWSLGNQCKQQWHPSPFEQKIPASILDTHTRPGSITTGATWAISRRSKISQACWLCSATWSNSWFTNSDDVDQRLRTYCNSLAIQLWRDFKYTSGLFPTIK